MGEVHKPWALGTPSGHVIEVTGCLRKISQAPNFLGGMNDQRHKLSSESQAASGKGDKPSPGGEFAGIGLQFALTVVAFVLLGLWLDKRLGSSPWFVVALTFVGAGGGMYSMYRRAVASQRGDGRGPR